MWDTFRDWRQIEKNIDSRAVISVVSNLSFQKTYEKNTSARQLVQCNKRDIINVNRRTEQRQAGETYSRGRMSAVLCAVPGERAVFGKKQLGGNMRGGGGGGARGRARGRGMRIYRYNASSERQPRALGLQTKQALYSTLAVSELWLPPLAAQSRRAASLLTIYDSAIIGLQS